MPTVTIDQAMKLAVAHHQAGRLGEAEGIYRQILAREPGQADALHLLGVLAHQTGHHEAAVGLIRQAVAQRPGFPEALNNLGNIFIARGEGEQAIGAFRAAIALKRDYADAHNNLGVALLNRGDVEPAIDAYRAAIAANPALPTAHYNLGVALQRQGQLDAAAAAYRMAVQLQPKLAGAHNNLGNTLRDQGELDAAIEAFGAAIAVQGDYADAHNNLGNALRDKGRLDDAVAAYRAAISFKADYADAYNNLGNALRDLGQLDQSMEAYRAAIALRPGYVVAHNNLGGVLKDAGRLDDAIASFRRAMEIEPAMAAVHSNLVYTLYFHPGYDAAAIRAEHERWNRLHAEPLARLIRPHGNERSKDRRLKVGYVSPDLCGHPVGFFLLPLLEVHDREQFEIFGYAHVANPDGVTRELRANTDHWRSIVGLSDEAAAQQIREDGIDILIDLSLHMANNRLLVFARKPAPVQVTYLGYAGTTGMGAMDYRLSDPYLDPAGMHDEFYVERTVRLPESYWCYAPVYPEMPVAPLPAQRGTGLTFGSLNNFCKVTEGVLAVWGRLLKRVPESRLVIHAHAGSHRERTLATLRAAGVEPGRVSFVGRLPIEAYCRQYDAIDIALDPFPYAGGTTTCDALWMGVPVVSLCGETAVARGGLSVLSNIALAELVARSQEEYVEIAAKLAMDLPRLAELRETLRERMLASPLMDAKLFARNVEAAYREMWRRWCEEEESSGAGGNK